MKTILTATCFAACALTLTVLAGCGGSNGSGAASAPGKPAAVRVKGAGSTFDEPLFVTAFAHYPPIKFNYSAVGSGAGQTELEQGLVDFGAFDVPVLPSGLAAAKGPIVQFPVALGGAGVIYNLKGVTTLRLTGPVLAAIYMGHITSWTDPAITRLNPGAALPHRKISVVYRSDSSGTSYMFTDYLSHVSPTWKSKVGAGKSPAWPVGTGSTHSSGVSAAVKSTPGSIGYVETSYAYANHITMAMLKNRAGAFVRVSAAGVAADAAQFKHVSARRFSIVNGPGARSYPISSYSWSGIYAKQGNKTLGRSLVRMFTWLDTRGQKYGVKLYYVPLPGSMQTTAAKTLKSVKF